MAQNVVYTPIVQDGFTYDMVHDQLYEQFSSGSGSVSVTNGTASISIGTGIGDYFVLRSKQVIKYRSGYTTVVRFSAKFDSPVANSIQMCGVGSATDDIYMGYSGTDLVARISSGGKREVRKLEISASATGSETFTLTLNGTEYTGNLSSGSTSFNAHQIVNENTYSGYIVQNVENTIFFISREVGADNGTFSFSSTGNCSGTFSQVTAGQSLTTTLFTSDNWNGNASAIRRLDPQTWNMYEIEYGWYGVTNVIFRLFNEYTNEYENIHTVKYSDAPNTALGLNNPSMYIQRLVASLGSSTALSLEVSSVFAGMIGTIDNLILPRYSISNKKTISSSTETVLLCMSHRDEMYGKVPIEKITITCISIATSGSDPVEIYVYKNPASISAGTTTDFLNLKYVNTYSITLYDTDSDTFSGGTLLEELHVSGTGQLHIKYSNNELYMQYGESIIFVAESASGNTIDIAVSFSEDV